MKEKKLFGKTRNGENVYEYTVNNGEASFSVLTYGATLRTLTVPSESGNTDVVLGYDSVSEYENNDGYLGATIGRNANRIKDGKFDIYGVPYAVTINEKSKSNNLHGGFCGFDSQIWNVLDSGDNENSVEMSLFSKNGTDGFPGDVLAYARFSLDKTTLTVEYTAKTDKNTVCNMTNHAYFNLNGAGEDGAHDVYLKIDSDYFTPVDENLVTTGEILSVSGTPFDFTDFKQIKKEENADNGQIKIMNGYDVNYCLGTDGGLNLAATAASEKTGIIMKVFTTRPAIQFYSACCLTERKGKNNKIYRKNSAFCLETQTYPCAVSHPHFPTALLKTNEKFRSVTKFEFTKKG